MILVVQCYYLYTYSVAWFNLSLPLHELNLWHHVMSHSEIDDASVSCDSNKMMSQLVMIKRKHLSTQRKVNKTFKKIYHEIFQRI